MENKKQTILITGAYGFVGTNISNALKDNYNLWALDIEEKKSEAYTRFFKWDDLNKIPEVDAIIHLAGKAHDTRNQTERQVYFDINTGLTQKIYDWFLNSGAEKFIFFSSVKAAANRVEGEFLTEDIVPAPIGPYGESKIAAENYILDRQTKNYGQQSKDTSQNNQKFQTSNVKRQIKRTYILRPSMIHGPGNKGNLNLLYNVVKKGIPWPLGAFENRRSFTSIDNLSFVLSEIMQQNIESGIYNMCDDESISTNELVSIISKAMHKPLRIWKWNKRWIEMIAALGSKVHFPLNKERLQKLTENYVVSNHKIKKALKLDKMPVSADDGMKKTIESFG